MRDAAARRGGRNSALVKTSWHGGDPNWGRIIDTLGYSSAKIVEGKVDLGYSDDRAAAKNSLEFEARAADEGDVQATLVSPLRRRNLSWHISLNLGKANAVMYAADLTEEYVDFNKGDVGDPATLWRVKQKLEELFSDIPRSRLWRVTPGIQTRLNLHILYDLNEYFLQSVFTLAAVVAMIGNPSRVPSQRDSEKPQYYELRVYTTKSADQQQRINDYWQNAAVPAYNRAWAFNPSAFLPS